MTSPSWVSFMRGDAPSTGTCRSERRVEQTNVHNYVRCQYEFAHLGYDALGLPIPGKHRAVFQGVAYEWEE